MPFYILFAHPFQTIRIYPVVRDLSLISQSVTPAVYPRNT